MCVIIMGSLAVIATAAIVGLAGLALFVRELDQIDRRFNDE